MTRCDDAAVEGLHAVAGDVPDLLSPRGPRRTLPLVNGDTEVLDPVRRDADRVVLCRCGGAGRVVHAAVHRPGEPEGWVRATFTCTWDRPGPHEPLLPPRRD